MPCGGTQDQAGGLPGLWTNIDANICAAFQLFHPHCQVLTWQHDGLATDLAAQPAERSQQRRNIYLPSIAEEATFPQSVRLVIKVLNGPMACLGL